jgi:hypothetical protein
MMSAFDGQVGGNHYKSFKIQPAEFIHVNGLGYMAGNIVKYVCRYPLKHSSGIEDLRKARQYLDMLIESEMKAEAVARNRSIGDKNE